MIQLRSVRRLVPRWLQRSVGERRPESPLLAVLAVGTFVFALFTGLRFGGALQRLELGVYDQFVRLGDAGAGSGSRVRLIEVSEDDIRALGHWPLTDAEIARALERLARDRPRAIGLDIYRDIEVPDARDPTGREALRAAFARYSNIVGIMKLAPPPIPPPSFLAGTEQVGFSDMLVDDDGRVRRGLLYLEDGATVQPSLALRIALRHLESEGIVPQPDPAHPEYLRLGSVTFRPLQPNDGGYVRLDNRGYQYLMDLQTGASFPSFSLTALLAGTVPSSEIAGKVVLVGVTAESVPDIFHTAFSHSREGTAVHGLVLHANMVSQLLAAALDGRVPITPAPAWQGLGLLLLWSLTGAAVGRWARSPWRFFAAAPLGMLAVVGLGFGAFTLRWWVPVVPAALAWAVSGAGVVAYSVGQERRQRAFLMQLFRSHISKPVADAIWLQRRQFMDGERIRPQRLTATVLFADIRGFTTLSEQLTPTALQDWLNECMSAMAHEVMRHDGVVDKYIGDAVMAVFGVPIARTTAEGIRRDASNAVACGLAMVQRVTELNQRWHERGLPAIGMRIGICTGPVVAGSLGASDRHNFTVIGDTVNTASRLESLRDPVIDADQAATTCRVLIAEATLRHLDQQFETQAVGGTRLKGKAEPVMIYRVLRRSQTVPGSERLEKAI